MDLREDVVRSRGYSESSEFILDLTNQTLLLDVVDEVRLRVGGRRVERLDWRVDVERRSLVDVADRCCQALSVARTLVASRHVSLVDSA